jgi:thiamine biosynthesis lipoprotein
VPSAPELAPLLALIGWDKVQRAPGKVRLALAGMELDFGGFGKEYAADRAAALLEQGGVRHGYVNLGGDLRVVGPQPDGQPWLIGIQHPRDPGACVASIAVSQGALATSGDYERYFDLDGRRYCHVLDPGTAMPVSHWQSVSVLAPLAVLAGSVSTIAMLKEEHGLAFLAASGVSYLAIDHAGQTHHHRISGEYA